MPEQRVADKIVRMQKRIDTLEDTVLWALGYGLTFPEMPKDSGLYWWRDELATRAFQPKGEPSKRKVAKYRKSIDRRKSDAK